MSWQFEKKWKIVNNNLCPLCEVKHDIIHLLYFCEKAKAVCENINLKFNSQLTFYNVFGLCEENNLSNVFISFIALCIYKEWLCLNEWAKSNTVSFVKSNVAQQLIVYKCLRKQYESITQSMEYLVNLKITMYH